MSNEKPAAICGACVYCLPGPKTKEDVFSRLCFRNPPTAVGAVMPQGLAVMSVRPEIRIETPACGEFEDAEDDGAPTLNKGESPGMTA